MIKTVLIEDHELPRSALKQMLELDAGIRVIGETGTGTEGVKLVRHLKPDVVVLDVNLPDISGLEVTHRLLAQGEPIKILALSASGHDFFSFKLLNAGALSYLTKDTPREEFLQALKKTSTGQRYVSSTVANRFIFSQVGPRSQRKGFLSLSDRETEIIMMAIHGIEVKRIAQKLHISPKTVSNLRGRALEKLGITTDRGLIILALRHGIVTLDEVEPT